MPVRGVGAGSWGKRGIIHLGGAVGMVFIVWGGLGVVDQLVGAGPGHGGWARVGFDPLVVK